MRAMDPIPAQPDVVSSAPGCDVILEIDVIARRKQLRIVCPTTPAGRR